MPAGVVLLTRHAEKTDDPLDPFLSPEGLLRAAKLADYIPRKFGTPAVIFASAISKRSRRSYQTIKPLSQAHGITIDTSFAGRDYRALAHRLLTKPRYDGKLVLVCWHHGSMPLLAQALKIKRGEYPDPWDPAVFNLILKVDFSVGVPAVEHVVEPF